jgi:hypothetical protein
MRACRETMKRESCRGGSSMANKKATDEALVQLAMRVPQGLLRRLKIFCVQRDVSMQAFIARPSASG